MWLVLPAAGDVGRAVMVGCSSGHLERAWAVSCFDMLSCVTAGVAIPLMPWGSGGIGHMLSAFISPLGPVCAGAAIKVWNSTCFIGMHVILGKGWS